MRLLGCTILLVLLTVGCRVGPNYRPPSTFMPDAYTENRDDSVTLLNEDLFHWWTSFNDPFLDQLLEEALGGSFDYLIALEKICQARAQYWNRFAQILPEIDCDGQASRFRTSQSFAGASTSTTATPAISPTQNFYQVGFDMIWQIDLFGQLRRSAEAAYDIWQATSEDARGVKITVLSEVANIYVTICSLQKKRNIALQVVEMDEELLSLAEGRFQAGISNDQEVEIAKGTLELDKSAVYVIDINLKQAIYSLAILLGRCPEGLIEDFEVEREIPEFRERVLVGLPADLLRRRPDILSAERQLAAATEEIGVAVADLFPQINLTGSSSSFAANPLQGANIGFASDTVDKLFTSPSRIWGIGSLVTFPVFDFGKRFANVRVQVSLRRQAYLSYQKTVIAALQETEQALAAYFNEEKREKSLSSQVSANLKNFELTMNLYQAGLTDYTQVLQAKEIWLNSITSLTDSQQSLATDLIAIYKGLGGDW